MTMFRNILFVTRGIGDQTCYLEQALFVAHSNSAELKILILLPEFPDSLAAYKKPLHDAVVEHVDMSIRCALTALSLRDGDIKVSICVEHATVPVVCIVRYALRNDCDLVMKPAERAERGSGPFCALDMDLLRKCTCTVWLCRHGNEGPVMQRIAVAIDPVSQETVGPDLAQKLLKYACALSTTYNAQLHVISCWDFPLEKYLQGNVWIQISDAELKRTIVATQSRHERALAASIKEAGLEGAPVVHHLRGKPDALIPKFVKDEQIDVLVMGTVGRSGIPGWVMGNTAENVLQAVNCSVIALKPDGFVSPVGR
jgi:nucleotide-binding universal stress UspA family protein